MLEVQQNPRLFKRFALVWLLVLPVLFYAFFVGGRGWLSTNLFVSSNQTLSLYVTGLQEILNKYKALPEIYAEHPVIVGLLQSPDDADLQKQANSLLEKFNISAESADTYVLDAQGLTLAASNWNLPKTFVGRSFSFRPYFQDAMRSGSGRFFALGTTSLQRGYYLSSAIKDALGTVLGVMVVKVNVATVEQGWTAPHYEVLVTDQASIVFLSSRPEWLYNAVHDPSSEALAELGATRRYANKTIGRLPFDIKAAAEPWVNTFKPQNKSSPPYLATHQDVEGVGWRVWILADRTPLTNSALAYAGGLTLLITLGAIAIVSLIERRLGLLRALDVQQRAREVLENSANELELQVEKRTADLRRAQNELVQAGKMAALGQMSVGINHELNQPLTAIRSYADNAGKFLDQGRKGEAAENLSLISALSERMGDIILRLKIFARESSDERTPQVLQAVFKDTRRIVDPRLKKDRVKLDVEVPDSDITVLVNDVRLEQVLVNLINNAIDALEQGDERRIVLKATVEAKHAHVAVRDFGSGIPGDVIDHLFEPFFTTKKVGLGLGLGLSISSGIVSEFGGELKAQNLVEGGAVFSFNIPLAPKSKD